MSVDTTKLATLAHLGQLAQKTVTGLSTKIQNVTTSGSTVNFFTGSDTSGTPAFTFDFPEEIFLDQAGTTLVENFAWSAATYPGSTNPNLDGKVVLVLAVKGDKQTNPTTKYSFVNLENLVDTYTAADNTINISGYTVAVKISAAANNAISVNNDGLHVDISGKVDKETGKGLSTNDYTTAEKTKLAGIAEGAQVNVIESVKVNGTALTITDKAVNVDLSGKADKVTSATAGNIATLDANGNIVDSGHGVAADSDVTAYLATFFS